MAPDGQFRQLGRAFDSQSTIRVTKLSPLKAENKVSLFL